MVGRLRHPLKPVAKLADKPDCGRFAARCRAVARCLLVWMAPLRMTPSPHRPCCAALLGAVLGCAALPALSATLTVSVMGQNGRGVQDAVLLLEPLAGKAPVKPAQGVEISQQNKSFMPAVSVIPVGTKVAFPNQDTVRHHVYSFSDAKKFELKLYAGKPENPVSFDRAGVVVLGCNIHDQMVGWIIVSDTPWFAKSAAGGRATLVEVPAGAYRLRSWHPDLPVGSPGLEQNLTLGAADMAVTIKLPVAGT